MHRPKQLLILGRKYRVTWQKPRNLGRFSDAAGRVVTDFQRIWVDRTNHPQRQKTVLLHEVVHVLDFHHGIGLDEKQTEALACGLYEFAQRNRKAWKSLAK